MVLDNWATFASFVSQFAPIKILPWQGKKKKNIIMILMIIINYVKSSKNGWAKHFFPLQRVYTRRDESWRLQSRQYLLWVFHAEIGNHKYNFHVKERKKRKIHVFANTGLWMYAGLLVPSAGRSFVQNRFLFSLIRVMIWKKWYLQTFFCSMTGRGYHCSVWD